MNSTIKEIKVNAKGSVKMPIDESQESNKMAPNVALVNIKNLVSLMQFADLQVKETGGVYFWKGFDGYTKKAILTTFNSVSELQGVSAAGRIAYVLSEPSLLSQIYNCTTHFTAIHFTTWIHRVCDVRSLPYERQLLAKRLTRSNAKETEPVGKVELQSGFSDFFSITMKHELSKSDRILVEDVRDTIKSVIPDAETIDKAKKTFDMAAKPVEMTQNVFSMIQNVCQGPHYELFVNILGPLTLTYIGWTARQNTSRKAVFFCLSGLVYSQMDEKYRPALITLMSATAALWTYDAVIGDDEVDLQSGEILPVAGILASFLAVYGVERKRSGEISQLFRMSKDLSGFLDKSISFIKGLIDGVSEKIYGIPFFSDNYDGFEALEQQFFDVMNASYAGKLEFTYVNADKIKVLSEEYKRLALSSSAPDKKGVFTFATKRSDILEKLFSSFAGFLVDPHGYRQEPVCVMIVGPPGTHKTTLCDAVEKEALRLSFPGPDLESVLANRANYVFNRLAYEFWDGYNVLTEIVKFDDFGQVRDSIGSPNVNFDDLIHGYNTAAYPLNMSRVEEKGKIYFKAKWILGTSNCTDTFQVSSLVSEEALTRRMDLLIEPVVRLEYKNAEGKLNMEHPDLQIKGMDPTLGVRNIDPNFFYYKVKRTNPVLGIERGDTLTWMQVRAAMAFLFKQKKAIFNLTMKHNKNGYKTHEAIDFQSGEIATLKVERPVMMDQTNYMLIRPRNLPEVKDITGNEGYQCWLAAFADSVNEVTGNTETTFLNVPSFDIDFEENLMAEHGYYFTTAFQMLYGMLEANYVFINRDYTNLPPDIKVQAAFYLILLHFDTQTAVSWYLGGKCPPIEGGRIGFTVTRQVKSLYREMINYMEPSNSNSFMERYFKLAVKHSVSAMAIAAALAVAVTVGKFAVNYMFPDIENQGNYMSARNKNSKKDTAVRRPTAGKISLQGADTAALNLSKSIMKSNGYDICLRANGAETMLGTGIFLDKTHFMFPLHFLEIAEDSLEDDPEASIKVFNSTYFKVFTVAEFFEDAISYDEGGAHCCIARIKGLAFDKRDIIKNFITNEDAAALTSVDLSVIVQLNSQNKAPLITTGKVDRINFSVLKMTKGIHYAADSAKGDCGAPIFLRDSRMQGRRIVGIHLAGTAKGHSAQNAYASLITQEMLKEMLELFDTELQAGNDSIIREIGTSAYVHDPYSRSRIKPSPLQNTEIFPKPPKQPAKCYPHDNKDPLQIALSSYYKRDLDYDEDCLEMAADDLFSSLASEEPLITEDLIPFEEALWGNDKIPNRRSVPTATSAGFPYKFTHKSIKQDVLPKRDDINMETFNMLRENCYSIISEANAGIRRDWYYLISLKDETLPLSKIMIGGARPFCGTPLELYITNKMLFGQFVEYYFTNCLDNENAATLNPYLGWQTLARKLSTFDSSFETTKVDSSDYSKFDASNNPTVMNYCLQIMQRWYEQQGFTFYHKARETIFLEMTNSKHICLDKILEWDGSLPSGSYLTLVVNCLSNGLIMRYAYFSLSREQEFIRNFQSVVVFVDLGDDNIYSAHPDIRSWFNPVTIAEKAKDLGFKMTADNKGDLGEWRTFKDVTFLKRSFLFEGNKVLCPLALETILSTPTWTKSGTLYKKIFYDNIKFFFRELSLHPKDVWDRYAKIMRDSLVDIGEAKIDNIYMGQKWWRAEVLKNDPFTVDWM